MSYPPRQNWNSGLNVAALAKQSRRTTALVFICILAVVLAFAGLVVWAWAQRDAVYAEFMSGCEQDHKHYECMLLWRASDRKSDDPVVVTVPTVIQSPR